MRHILPVVTLALAVGFAIPASAQSREQRQMMADLRILQIQAQELQNLVNTLNQAMTDALKSVNTRLAEQTDATRKSFADQKLSIDALGNDLRIVREKVDDSTVRIGTLAQEVDSLRELVTGLGAAAQPQPVADPDAAGAVASDGSIPPTAASPSPAPTGAAAAGASPDRLWNSVMADYYAGQYELAVIGFESYVRSFPKYDRADDAQVLVGHAYMLDGKYDKAVEAYDTAIRTYPNSDLLPEAYYKKGEALLNLKENNRAREAFEHVIKTYPNSDAAIQAKQRLPKVQVQP
jgi:tol-pal system protein YbgF